ncbi:MAG: type II toxin-antitoxin system HicB family antitoxin [Desulfomonile tiedjei]|nr:type II toxin-antitoxin system HicB family antitoxin [Desulfomonile tiedjei]
MKYRILIEPDEDGVFVAEVPSLPGCVSQSRTRQEAIENVKEAIGAYLESLAVRGEPIPPLFAVIQGLYPFGEGCSG